MIEDTTLVEYRVGPLSSKQIAGSDGNETAYDLITISHGAYATEGEEYIKLKSLKCFKNTLGFEIGTECDFAPFERITYNTDKTINAEYYRFDTNRPSQNNRDRAFKYPIGEKVLCLIHQGYDAVFPAVIVGPITEEYVRNLYKTDDDMQIGYSSADEAIENWSDWEWDSVIVRPLVRLQNEWDEMGNEVLVNRVYIFPYKQFNLKN